MRGWLFAAIVALTIIPSVVMAQGITSPVITAPTAGQILRGQVSITGTTDMSNFASAELDFAYASDSTGSWFLIQTFSQPVANSELAIWDTTSISDGDYILRLRVTLQDGSSRGCDSKGQSAKPSAASNSYFDNHAGNYFHTSLRTSAFNASRCNCISNFRHRRQYFPRRLRFRPIPLKCRRMKFMRHSTRCVGYRCSFLLFLAVLIRLRRS